ncbi:unnamed protein product [Linum tenue]|uniref:Plant bHLH transcription factor ACT-like domain-containing protein n=1 Tax=Linum tenue TaxID=586396 RepID=A0AAV0PZX7_9ROSI|nr:unnamed protein product [Linum tenue]
MGCRMQRRLALRRKLHILRMTTHSQSVKQSSAFMGAFIYLHQLKLKLEAMKTELSELAEIRREYLNRINKLQLPKREVKVEKGEKGFQVKVTCEKGKDKLVSVLEAFEEMGLSVLHGKVSCTPNFVMEAIVDDVGSGQGNETADVEKITQALVRAIHGLKTEGKGTRDA